MRAQPPIFLFTDFGSADIYVGQVKAVLHAEAPRCSVIDLLNDAPSYDIVAAAHLLAALAARLPRDAVTLAVVDPGVGGSRAAVAVESDGRWYVGPDNGLMSVVMARAGLARCFTLSQIVRPESVSFHGRDLFAPVAAAIARGASQSVLGDEKPRLDVALDPGDLPRVIYIDHYGNAMTGLRAHALASPARITIGERAFAQARVFSEVGPGEVFWYVNSIGLVEIAANQSSAAAMLGLTVGQSVGLGER